MVCAVPVCVCVCTHVYTYVHMLHVRMYLLATYAQLLVTVCIDIVPEISESEYEPPKYLNLYHGSYVSHVHVHGDTTHLAIALLQ